MKVYIGFDDGALIGLFESHEGVLRALTEAIADYRNEWRLEGPELPTPWVEERSAVSRHIECDGHAWDQWYEVHEVQP